MLLENLELVGHTALYGGSFGEIWKGLLNGQTIAVKVLRVYLQSDKEKLLKVVYFSDASRNLLNKIRTSPRKLSFGAS
jgi:hypothetical protein